LVRPAVDKLKLPADERDLPLVLATSVADAPVSARERAAPTVLAECTYDLDDAAERTRTSTPVRARRPERRVYTNFTTAAGGIKLAGRRFPGSPRGVEHMFERAAPLSNGKPAAN
jgi:hypothetical protein